MNTYILRFVLESDATFGRGDGLVGVVDVEVQHDEWGCPFLGGRSLKGLLVSECAEILAALPDTVKPRWQAAAQRLFGSPGSGQDENAVVSIGDAQLPKDLRAAIRRDVEGGVSFHKKCWSPSLPCGARRRWTKPECRWNMVCALFGSSCAGPHLKPTWTFPHRLRKTISPYWQHA